jgi:SsrA-binding protein
MKKEEGIKVICENRKAWHNYFIEEKYEAGIVLKGTEVKSLRDGKANLLDAYAVFKNGELFLINAHIGTYIQGNIQNHEPLRSRKLLLNADEIQKLWKQIEIRGHSLVPLKMYFKNGLCKVEIALGKGKKSFDKRASEKDKEAKRTIDKIQKNARNRG